MAMLNIEAFLELCRRAAIERDPTALAVVLTFFIDLLYLLRFERVDNLGACRIPRNRTEE